MEIIYSKFTHSRKSKYQITTQIIKKNDGLFVYKFGGTHLFDMVKYSLILKQEFNVSWCSLFKDGVIFPFIYGKSLEDLMNEGRVYEALDIFKNIMNVSTEEFLISDDFIKYFGDVSYSGKAIRNCNIDMVFSNIILADDGPVIIDYEWCVPFLVPIDFIMYRALKIYFIHNPNCKVNFDCCLDYLNIKKCGVFDLMIDNFSYMIEEYNYLDYCKNELYIFDMEKKLRLEIELLNDKDRLIENLKNLELKNRELFSKLNNVNQSNNYLIEDINGLNKEINELNSIIKKKDEYIDILNIKIDNVISSNLILKKNNVGLNEIKNSNIYRLSLRYYKIRDYLFPYNSRRRLLVKIIIKAIRHPIDFIKKINSNNIKKFFKYKNSEGGIRALERVDNYYQYHNVSYELELFDMNKTIFDELVFPKCIRPLVSIIIPVYNQFSYTYGCLSAILNNTKEIDYEVIIADDNSLDETLNINKYIKNIKVIRNDENVGFIRNCNNASLYAEGEYLVFLNNDTNVLNGWLKSLINTYIDYNAGIAGSKLIYPDGRLQEAGGILWRDGSAWNYGNKKDPTLSEYNYVKSVDYISGASIMISKRLWRDIGGFDERYAPAYCEDSDLAFEVRKRGYEVIYDPNSVVVHYEGVSNGKDVNSGIKEYQVRNSKIFYQKWECELLHHFDNGENVFLARDRSVLKKCILVIDHYVPEYDKDAGSRTVFSYLQILVSLGFNVKFIGENFYESIPYTRTLQRLGIEVLYGKYYKDNYKKWLVDNGKYFNYVLFNRPHITDKFIDIVKSCCVNAKFIYYGHDLHFMRLLNEYELKKDIKILKESEEYKRLELMIFKKVNLVYYPSTLEVNKVKEIDTSANVKVLQPYIFDLKQWNYNPKKREGILFVGGFRHSPNLDGILWFINDVYNNDVKLYIAGSYPPIELKNLENDTIIVKGFVSDEELRELYNKVRLVVAPIRYGAGIKGKIIEAMAMSVPVITTECGGYGIFDGLVIDDKMEYSNLYNDFDKLVFYSKKGYDYILNNYSKEKAREALKNDLKELE